MPPSTTRREVLSSAAAFAIPAVIPSGVLASRGRPGANDRIGVAGIGIGRQGRGLIAQASATGLARIVAICDVNTPRARETAAPYGAAALGDYRKVLERADVDAVITATPEHWRSLVCIAACQAGKDLYVEKPMTLTVREGRLMVQAARKYGRVFQVGSQQRSMKQNRLGCELVRNGRLGRLERIIAHNYPSPWEGALPAQPVPSGLDWEAWCGPTALVPYNADLYTPRGSPGWISFRPYSGGEMTGWGSHGLDQVQWALGMDESGPVEVWAEGAPLVPPTYRQPESRARGDRLCASPRLFYRYASGVVMELGDGPAGGAVFVGSNGRISIDRARCAGSPAELVTESLGASAVRLPVSDDHMRDWLQCIVSRRRPVADVEAGHRTATVCHIGNIARYLGRRLRWDPVREEFEDDPEANTHLSRRHRRGYQLPSRI